MKTFLTGLSMPVIVAMVIHDADRRSSITRFLLPLLSDSDKHSPPYCDTTEKDTEFYTWQISV